MEREIDSPLLSDDHLQELMGNAIERVEVAREIRGQQHRENVKFIEKQRWVDAYGFTCLSPRDWQSLNEGKPLLQDKKLEVVVGDVIERLEAAKAISEGQLKRDIEWIEKHKWTDVYEYTSLESKDWSFFKRGGPLEGEGII